MRCFTRVEAHDHESYSFVFNRRHTKLPQLLLRFNRREIQNYRSYCFVRDRREPAHDNYTITWNNADFKSCNLYDCRIITLDLNPSSRFHAYILSFSNNNNASLNNCKIIFKSSYNNLFSNLSMKE